MNDRIISLIICSTIAVNSFTGVCFSKSLKNVSNKNVKTQYNKIHDEVSTKEYNWYFQPKNDNTPPAGPKETTEIISKYNCFHLGDTSKKVLYLTFDEGYEAGYTAPILDVLKNHKVKAAFFVVKPYLVSSPDLIKRMVTEGHLICNHSNHHLSMASIKDEKIFDKELSDVEDIFENITHKKMSKYFRPPMGKYSELSLLYTKNYGYKTIFWSFAYMDWLKDNQPSHADAKRRIMQRTHNGGIILLHAVSKTNAEILDDVITEWEKQGYVLKSLDELPKLPIKN